MKYEVIYEESKKLNEVDSELQNKEFILEIEPISAPSQLDDRMLVSEFMSAVTLLTYRGESENHAKICFEGIENGSYFAMIGHFTGEDTVDIYEVEKSKKVKFTTRSEIWMRQSENVQKVIEMIKKEKNEIPNLPYSYFGKKSVVNLAFIDESLHGGDPNCLDWAREKLALLDIKLEENECKKIIKNTAEYIIAAARFYTREPEYYLNKPVKISI